MCVFMHVSIVQGDHSLGLPVGRELECSNELGLVEPRLVLWCTSINTLSR